MGAIIAIMLGISTLLGALALFGLIWGVKNRQFDDYSKFLDGTKYDSEDSLNDAYKMEKRKEELIKKKKEGGYRPPD
ncbi:cytochrome C oxidase subunit II [Campylobacter hyointestinalis]|uniref:Cbb3-type cytochrome oxidase assembly protein CcoS n=1 Tax=Campylobacter hyointestinalis subsp. hyointestinalis TaxID=91352 RepID=A0A855N5A3_CAMHY|nr:cbb3-type cytochrome oxidase assembly protein CcoS [Campylobacter hyointestinalis]PPB51797.1 cbb3-type cytochrome oxidase assembly protein CcoS [Campylobacter hyointestinalis subsp. hyointestinalis]PPB54888.1 cbb3-type cytochrome oxidase assembly protein CcoS [Campylobacter hyointestinalis subsp. hyointestinalis]PPB57479.1 cbb3-type cytochrome oxidase assembly protein CcoS [Campylobacter hyointestinalis subsp. hyointestinalis]PPB58476.1 cbb3-type cytochrome oxidase assembly protein CcoS [Cam